MNTHKTILSFLFSFLFIVVVYGKKIPTSNAVVLQTSAGCSPSTSVSDLSVGNVRASLLINGDMWWDLVGSPRYEIPKGSGKHSLAGGALWIGGKEAGSQQLRIAAQTYRQSGSDFWPGPIDTSAVDITSNRCTFYDRHWNITRQEVWDFINGGTPTTAIIDWPGNGNPAYNESHFLAPFYDNNADGIYNHLDGDYPKYEFGVQSSDINNRLNGDQTIWWVFNDVGNVHSETQSLAPLGVEIHAQAYAFCSPDSDLSNTTFYTYKIINRSSFIYNETYIGHFTDPDLGNYLDDYIGCDVARNLGYCYNGDSNDDGALGYGTIIPAVGIDLLTGSMNKFLTYNNDATTTGNPISAQDHYYYLMGFWKDGTSMRYGADGHNGTGDTCDFMLPGDSDPLNLGTHGIPQVFQWTEKEPTAGGISNIPGDRRFLMNTNLSTITPGQVTYITKAAVWAIKTGGPDSSLAALKIADDKIQSFFDSYYNNISTCILTTGIENVHHVAHSVFPSPASDYFVIRFPENSDKLSGKVFSADGKLVYETKESIGNELRIITSEWPQGVYYYRVNDLKNNFASGKIMVINN